jgi:hypothetical protein
MGMDASFDDLALPHISRLLMEEGTEDHLFFLYPNHPTLLRAQLPFASVLVHGSGSGSASALSPSYYSSDATASPSPSVASLYDVGQISRPPYANASSASPRDGVQPLLVSACCPATRTCSTWPLSKAWRRLRSS